MLVIGDWLPASVDSTEINDIVKAVRELTGVQHIQQSVSAHTITVRDSVSRVQLAGALIHQMERIRGEVLLEIDLLEVDRSLSSKLGVTPPSSVRLVTVPPDLFLAKECLLPVRYYLYTETG